ncbi:nuclear transport factor 2 family protein [Stappia indica]|uniref:nuclear transport factor 2 family protein n=1 Tax=Stappia indica TaxID=538381 RepID=UPI001D18815A|nr:nuclear transport factor 2 family protein [Stappia indica]MCC4246051.1 nuclear transport factor 2 family protein [Stappia indica]
MSAQLQESYRQVAAAAEAYAIAFHEGDTNELGRLFLPDCKLQFVEDGALRCFAASDWIAIVGSRASAAAQGHAPDFRLASLELAGPDCAAVTIEMTSPPNRFRDVLHLLRIDGTWRIVAKAFHRDLAG